MARTPRPPRRVCRALRRAFFVALLSPAGAPADVGCPAAPESRPLAVATVYDGDTLRLADGRRIRLSGINTPELAHDERPAEPLAERAHMRLRGLVDAAGGELRLLPAADSRDRYHRTLGFLFDGVGRDLGRQLVEEGLAYSLAVPPNTTQLDCYRAAERRARAARAGLWRERGWVTPGEAAALRGAFRLVRGRVGAVHRAGRGLRVGLEGGLGLWIGARDLAAFATDPPDPTWRGRWIEARGWVYPHRGEPQIQIRHPGSIERVEE